MAAGAADSQFVGKLQASVAALLSMPGISHVHEGMAIQLQLGLKVSRAQLSLSAQSRARLPVREPWSSKNT